MGLDMYLTREVDVKNWNFKKSIFEISITENGKPYKGVGSEITTVVEEAYWRKANAVHNWFVENCQDGVDECQRTPVSPEKLDELIGICERILDKPEIAHELLPTASGFFFGSTHYDEWYFEDIKLTLKQLKAFRKSDEHVADKWDVSYYYQSSW